MTKAEYELLFGKDSVDWRELKVAYENLANAIIESACDSYVNYKIAGDKNQIKSVKNFFNSQWYEALTNVDADYLMRMLDKKADRIKEERERQRRKELEQKRIGE